MTDTDTTPVVQEHPLAFFLREAQEMSDPTRDLQGEVVLHFADGSKLAGQIEHVDADARSISLRRRNTKWAGSERCDLADTPQHIVTAHIVRAYYDEAGA